MPEKPRTDAATFETDNLLGMKQVYTDENKMDCDTAGYEQEWYDETSSDLKNMLIKCQHPNTVPIFTVRCSAHSWFSTDTLLFV